MRNRLLNQSIYFLVVSMIVTLISISSVSEAKGQGKNKTVAKPATAANLAQPFSLEIDDAATRRGVTITLAVNSFTIIRCPKPPLQIIPGNEEAVVWRETLPGQTDIYITATIADITSNLILEFENAKSIIYFQTVGKITGSRPGTYTQEVVLNPVLVKQELSDSQAQVKKLNDEVNKLKQQILEKDKQSDEKVAVVANQAANQNDLDLIKMLEQAVYLGKINTVEANIPNHKGHIKISQASRLIRRPKGNIIIFAVENVGKDIHSIDFVRSTSGKILATFTSGKALPANLTTYIAVLVEEPFEANNLNNMQSKEVIFVINGVSVTAKFS